MSDTQLNIPAIRKALNLTQTQLAEMAGVNLSTVWRWENDGIPNRGAARALLDRLNSEAFPLIDTAHVSETIIVESPYSSDPLSQAVAEVQIVSHSASVPIRAREANALAARASEESAAPHFPEAAK